MIAYFNGECLMLCVYVVVVTLTWKNGSANVLSLN